MHGGWGEGSWGFRTNVWLLTLQSAPTCVPPAPGLIAWWPGEGDGTDRLSTNHLTLLNGLGFVPGLVGQAFSFTGAGETTSSSTPSLT
jgi:hypothetical protein